MEALVGPEPGPPSRRVWRAASPSPSHALRPCGLRCLGCGCVCEPAKASVKVCPHLPEGILGHTRENIHTATHQTHLHLGYRLGGERGREQRGWGKEGERRREEKRDSTWGERRRLLQLRCFSIHASCDLVTFLIC